ncbi:hypothetical protein BJ165DRAFT_1488872, partial [Panaeolus papilionaceus]
MHPGNSKLRLKVSVVRPLPSPVTLTQSPLTNMAAGRSPLPITIGSMRTNDYSDAAQGLSTITVDLIILICSYLKGRDIISLRQTCRHLADATQGRSIWLDAARRACRDNAVYEPSFNLPNATIRELEYMSTGIHRFNHLVQSAWRKAVSSYDTAMVGVKPHLRQQRPLELPTLPVTRMRRFALPVHVYQPTLRQLELVPGGRFLITSTLETKGRLDIYDLCICSKTQGDNDSELSLSVSIHPGPGFLYFALRPYSDSRVLSLLLTFGDVYHESSASEIISTSEIVDIDLSTPHPIIVKRHEKIKIPAPRGCFYSSTSVINDDFAVSKENQLTIGNFTTRMFARWLLPITAIETMITDTEIFVVSRYYRNNLLQGHYASVLVYNRPPLTLNSVALLHHHPKLMAPDVVLHLPDDIAPYDRASAVYEGYTGCFQYPWFDLIPRLSPPWVQYFTRVRILKDVDGQYILDVSSVPIQKEPVDCSPRHRVHELDEKISKWWPEDDIPGPEIMCSLEDIRPSGDRHGPDSIPSVVLYNWESDWNEIPRTTVQASLCAVSGRLVYSPSLVPLISGMVRVRKVVVVDFLPSTSSSGLD